MSKPFPKFFRLAILLLIDKCLTIVSEVDVFARSWWSSSMSTIMFGLHFIPLSHVSQYSLDSLVVQISWCIRIETTVSAWLTHGSLSPFFDVWDLNSKTRIWSTLYESIGERTDMVDNNSPVSTAPDKMSLLNSYGTRLSLGKSDCLWSARECIDSCFDLSVVKNWLFTVVALDRIVTDHLNPLVVYTG